MSDCIFCDILADRAPSSFVHRDEVCSAFVDIQPINPGHILVIPNTHATYLADLAPETGAQLFRIGQRIAAGLRTSGLRCDGVNLVLADGADAGQEVFHVHLHVIPRFHDDGFGFRFPPTYAQRPSRAELDAVAGRVRDTLAAS